MLKTREAKKRFVKMFRASIGWPIVAVALSLGGIGLTGASPAASPPDVDWRSGGRDLRDTRSQPFTQINPANVGRLALKWVFTTGGDVSATPAVTNGTVYFPDWAGNFYAVNWLTGAPRWSRKIADWTGVSGVVSRTAPVVDSGKVIIGDQGGLLATFSPQTGLQRAGCARHGGGRRERKPALGDAGGRVPRRHHYGFADRLP